MNSYLIFSTKKRTKIINSIIFKKDSIGISDIAKKLNLSKGFVSKYFDILVKENILKRIRNKFLAEDNLKISAIKIFLNINNFDTNLFSKYKFIRGIGLYGSMAKGVNSEDSDIDIWIKINNIKQLELAKLTNELNKIYKNIKPLFLTEEKIEILKRENPLFYYSLVFGSIKLYGEDIGI